MVATIVILLSQSSPALSHEVAERPAPAAVAMVQSPGPLSTCSERTCDSFGIDGGYADARPHPIRANVDEVTLAMEGPSGDRLIDHPGTFTTGRFFSDAGQHAAVGSGRQSAYDPLKTADTRIDTLELTVDDDKRSRQIPLLVYLPKSADPSAVIIHSHGLGGTRETSPFLGEHWAGRGYVAVFVQHPGSDDSVWKDTPALRRMAEMKKAASGQNLIRRVQDISAVIDALEKWNADPAHPLSGRLDLKHIGMSGHSFGAVTTQYVSGQSAMGAPRYTDDRICAAIPMSPSCPRVGDPQRAFGNVRIPWLCMTGTHDVALIGDADVESRLGVFPALPAGGKYELVLNNAEHSVFTERALPGDSLPRNPNHHRAIKAISTAFWDAWLREDPDARAWLDGDSVRGVLEADDHWQRK
jgi:predicted dienelactone hydrolase